MCQSSHHNPTSAEPEEFSGSIFPSPRLPRKPGWQSEQTVAPALATNPSDRKRRAIHRTICECFSRTPASSFAGGLAARVESTFTAGPPVRLTRQFPRPPDDAAYSPPQ